MTPVVLMSDYPDGSIEILDAPEEILVAQEFLEQAREDYVSHGDGIMTIHARNGDVSYGLYGYDLRTMCWKGTRSGR